MNKKTKEKIWDLNNFWLILGFIFTPITLGAGFYLGDKIYLLIGAVWAFGTILRLKFPN